MQVFVVFFKQTIFTNNNGKFTSLHKIFNRSSSLWKIIGNKMNKVLTFYNSNINYCHML